ncbi:ATP-dependent Clp protease ATP-binding subunit [Veillonella sp. S13053-19]|uniref:AAA family ATPase n=1 Tax=Veillonella sp. S13053-19 TaxID=2027456 RepID=UPI000CF3EB91|nr:AAA family ATPase [Veillonella sp. S13053-19]PQL16138.1 ATP-dependent Clp protease ATP-binding subunit [Veillonella sp. S13053-19]
MIDIELNLWLERFSRDIGYKSSVIVFGNTSDIMLNPKNSGKFDSVINTIISYIRDRGYKQIIKWDRVDGIDYSISDDLIDVSNQFVQSESPNDYDLGDYDLADNSNQNGNHYKAPDEFFPYMLNIMKNSSNKTAFVLDYSDYIFGNANSLSEKERDYLATLGKVLETGQSYNMLDSNFADIRNIVIIVAHNNAMIPPAFYLNNSMVGSVNIPLPGHKEREHFININSSCLNITQDIISDKTAKDDLIDALDGFSLKEIAQLMKLSRQISEKMSFEKLINLFKYGEKVSPWEELSKDKIERIEEELGNRVKGQAFAISKVKDVIIRAYTGFSGLQHSSKQKKPKGTLFFVGPTGVGKTELAKSLASFVFGDENACIRFDMSEYNHEHSDQRLVGAPPGYVGYEAGGQLTNAIKEKPFSVLLFDEIEKAHGRILDKFLQILEDGRLTDGKGETVYFSETIIIFTSNIGAAEVSSDMNNIEVKKQFVEKVKNHFIEVLGRPELLNRIGDNIVPFNFIDDPKVFIEIAKIKFKTIEDFVKERYGATIILDNEDKIFHSIALKAGKQNGGRGLLNVMEADIIDRLSKFIFERSDILRNHEILIKPFYPEKPELCLFDFILK